MDYYQVSQTLLDDSVRRREIAPLQAISDNGPKTILMPDRVGLGDCEGRRGVNVIDWLLGRDG